MINLIKIELKNFWNFFFLQFFHWASLLNKQILPRSVLPYCVHTGEGKKNGDERRARREPLALLLILSSQKYRIRMNVFQ